MKKKLSLLLNYILLAFRSLNRQKKSAFINIIGLSVGFVAFILIYLFLIYEHSYDKSWKDSEKIYRVTEKLVFGHEDNFAVSSYNVCQAMKNDIPEVEVATMIHRSNKSDDRGLTCWYEDKKFSVSSVTMADADFFKVFDYPFLEGNSETALVDPYSMVIDAETKSAVFGDEDAVGKVIEVDYITYTVTGVIDKDARLSHLSFDILISQSTLKESQFELWRGDWCWLIGYTYVKLKDESLAESFQEKVALLSETTIRPWIREVNIEGDVQLAAEPIRNVHFNTQLQYDYETNTNRGFVNMFIYIAAFLLLIASINYMNLTTARSMKRSREIGIRKVVGAYRSQLVFQFLSESIITTLLSFGFALLFTELLLPWFNNLIEMRLSLGMAFDFSHNALGIYLLLIVLFLGFLSGSFPAFVLSSFKPIHALQKNLTPNRNSLFSAINLRKILVIVQFVISIGMIICTLVVSSQLRYMRNYDYGINLNQNMVIYFPQDTSLSNHRETVREKLLNLPEVDKVSITQSLPGYQSGRLMFYMGDQTATDLKTMNLYMVDYEFLNFFDIRLKEGRWFLKESIEDSKTAFVVNQAAVDFLGTTEPIGFKMSCGLGIDGEIVGVVENFHYSSLHSPLEPLVFVLSMRGNPAFAAVHIATPDVAQAVEKISGVWQDFDQNHFLNYSFLDERFEKKYERESKMLSLFSYFSIIVVLISCLGLYGLSAFTVEQRTKEVGIRKILGSRVNQIVKLLVSDFIRLVVFAGIISIPIAYIIMNEWLSTFAYHVDLNFIWFALGFLIAVFIAVFTILTQVWKALKMNPIDVIKYE